MLSNNNKKGKPIALIKGGKYNNEIITISDDLDNGMKSLTLKKDNGKFIPLQDPKIERGVHYVTGPSGSGKSYWIGEFIGELKKQKKYKESPVYLFSPFDEDVSLDKINPIRINTIDLDVNPINFNDIDTDSILIFDDVDCLPKKIKEAVNILIDQILKGGRHYNQTIFITTHDAVGRAYATMLNEAHTITYFPFSGSKRKLLYLVESYCGLTKEDFKKIRQTKSRFCTIYKNYPMAIVTSNNIFTPSIDSDDD